jgi:hypothetical protein
MFGGKRDLIEVLETELRFLDNGGYRDPEMWRPQFIFLDSPTCMHPAGSGRPDSCHDCPIIGFVPKARRSAPVPCHHIPLTKEGFTVDSLSRWGTYEELQSALRAWLTEKITALKGHDEPANETCEEMQAFCNHMAG